MPIASGHARMLPILRFAPGEVDSSQPCFDGRRIVALKEGRPFAFLIDLLDDEGHVAFRIHYQDAASESGVGFPPREVVEEHPVDLAVVCMPSSWNVSGYPEDLLAWTRARHVLVTHYDDFMQPTDEPVRFVANLTDSRADAFMERVFVEMGRDGHEPRGPLGPACGPASAAWTMPLRGEWLRFAARP
jgi:hypothetical protein